MYSGNNIRINFCLHDILTAMNNCSSDELLWCQLHCICEGYFNGKENRYDSVQSIPQFGSGGTIRQRNYSYRCRAGRISHTYDWSYLIDYSKINRSRAGGDYSFES